MFECILYDLLLICQYMKAKEVLIRILKDRESEGILQSELYSLSYSKSTIANALERLSKEREIIRRKIGKKQYRIWLTDYAPFPIEGVIRVGILRAVEYPHVLLTVERLKSEGIDARVRIFDSAIDATRALAICQVDLACSPLVTQVINALVFKSIRIYAGCGFNGSGIVFKSGDAERYACSELSTMEANLKYYLKEERKLDLSEVDIMYFKSPERLVEAFTSCEVDAIAIWEPYLTTLKDFKVLEFKEILGRFPCCTLAVNKDFEEEQHGLLEKFLKTYERCSKKVYEEKDLAIKLMGKYLGFDESLLRISFGKFEYSSKITIDEISETLKRFGLVLTKSAIEEIFHERII